MRKIANVLAAILATTTLAGCTVHPAGEAAERSAAMRAGQQYAHPVEKRSLPRLTAQPTPEELVNVALLSNGDVERQYWQWRAALEQVPQEGTQKTGLMISLSSMINNGNLAWDTTTLAAGNDSMNNIVLPSKLRAAATVALEQAKAAGLRFDKARLDLRAKVLTAYDEYALSAELLRLDEQNIKLLQLVERITESRVATGGVKQQDLLKAATALAMARNDAKVRTAAFPGQVAAINRLLGRDPEALIDPPKAIPSARPLTMTDSALLALAAKKNPELLAEAHEWAAKHEAVQLAKDEYLPEFSVGVGTDLQGVAQSLMGSVMVPAVRYQAINAAIEQAKANLRDADAMQRQAKQDVAAQIVADLAILRSVEQQADFLESRILPQLQRITASARNAYAAGSGTLFDVIDAQRSLIMVRQSIAQMRAEREERLADIEAAGIGASQKASSPPVALSRFTN